MPTFDRDLWPQTVVQVYLTVSMHLIGVAAAQGYWHIGHAC